MNNPLDQLKVRCLAPGEDNLWHSCRLETESGENGEVTPFTQDPEFRPEVHLVVMRGEHVIGKMESILQEPHYCILVDPLVIPGEDAVQASQALISHGVQLAHRLKVKQVLAILQDRLPYLSALLERMPSWGFQAIEQKLLFELKAEDLPDLGDPQPGPEFGFQPIEGPEDRTARETLDKVLIGTVDAREGDTGASLLEEFTDRCRSVGQFHPEDWELLLHRNEPVGCLFPALLDPEGKTASVLHFGLAPGYRGQGLGKRLFLRALSKLRLRRPRLYLDSCWALNRPMVSIFRSLGFRLTTTQHYFKAIGSDPGPISNGCENPVQESGDTGDPPSKPLFRTRGLSAQLSTPDDREAVRALFERCRDYFALVTGAFPNQEDVDGVLQSSPKKAGGKKWTIGLFTDEGELVGLLNVLTKGPEDRDWQLGLLLLDPSHRGKGHGTSVIRMFEQWAGKQGAVHITLGVVEANERAHRFWKQLGFEDVETQSARRFGKACHAVIVMRRRLR